MVDTERVWEALKDGVCPKCGSKDISAHIDGDHYIFDCDDCDHLFKHDEVNT